MNSSVAEMENNKTSRFNVAQIAKKLVWRQLSKIHTGAIVLYEQGVRHSFGEPLLPGEELYSEMHIHDVNCYSDILTGGSIGAAEAYMTGDWTSPDLTQLVRVMAKNMDILDQMEGGIAAISKPMLKWFHRLNQNTEKGSRRNIASHYDLGNDFFKLFLDPTMMYSSGIFPHKGATMQQASETKLRRICDKLQLSEDDHVVEIGTGWGGFAIFAAKHYGCKVKTTTISEQQYLLAQERVNQEGLGDKITLLMEDYRKLEGTYDKLVSIEMIEAVGWQFYDTFFEKCSSLLKPNGSMLIQAITIEDQRYEKAKRDVDFVQKYIFPGSCIPSINALNTASMNSSDLRMIHLDDFAEHYATTLRTWNQALANNLDKVRAQGYSEDFIRMWFFYLCYCEGGFMERTIGVSHLVFAKPDFRTEKIQ